jgi:threonine/homoserine/homoserine lactone efflux protein
LRGIRRAAGNPGSDRADDHIACAWARPKKRQRHGGRRHARRFHSHDGLDAGLGALLAASASVFMLLKWIGAAYLIYLGIKLWRAPVAAGSAESTESSTGGESPLRIFLHSYLVTALNPKSLIFFVAFLPQFLDAARPIGPQLMIFEATFLALATANATLYGVLAAMARQQIRKPAVQRIVNCTVGSLMIGAGLLAVGWKRAT